MIHPNLNDFKDLSQTYNLIPVYEEILVDFETALSMFKKSGGDFLLESVENGNSLGRYSIIAIGKKVKYTLNGTSFKKECFSGDTLKTSEEKKSDNPLELIRKDMDHFNCSPLPTDFPPFFGGLIGYLGYETVTYFEDIPTNDGLEGIPDGILILPQKLLIMDNVKHTAYVIVPVHVEEESYDTASSIIESLKDKLASPYTHEKEHPFEVSSEIKSNFEKEEFLRAVNKCKEHIAKGDIIQVVLSQQFSIKTNVSPFELYRTLRHLNPSPYLYYLALDDFHLIGSSPEVMVRLVDGQMLLKPIAGTKKRGRNQIEDQAFAESLLQDPKERAEHLMLVDLGRNDLGRVAKAGSVKVSDYMSIEKYSHVMHIVSTVTGTISEGKDAFDLIAATFPAGTLSGAPKVRAMEIIADLENQRRGPYGGMVLALGYNGNLNSCITIRTVLLKNGEAYIQAGAGLVADSVPETEYKETQIKSEALVKALQQTVGGSP